MSPVVRPETAERLDLRPHPEGGWFRRTWASPAVLDGGRHAAVSCVVSPGFEWAGFRLA